MSSAGGAAGSQKQQQQPKRFAYRPLLGQDGTHRFGAAVDRAAPEVLTTTEAAAAALVRWGSTASAERCGLIDLRPPAVFAAEHLQGATSLPWGGGEEFIARAHELPERGATLALLADGAADATDAADHLRRAGYKVAFSAALSDPLRVALLGSVVSELLKAGMEKSCDLWHPSPCLTVVIDAIEAALASSSASAAPAAAPSTWAVARAVTACTWQSVGGMSSALTTWRSSWSVLETSLLVRGGLSAATSSAWMYARQTLT